MGRIGVDDRQGAVTGVVSEWISTERTDKMTEHGMRVG